MFPSHTCRGTLFMMGPVSQMKLKVALTPVQITTAPTLRPKKRHWSEAEPYMQNSTGYAEIYSERLCVRAYKINSCFLHGSMHVASYYIYMSFGVSICVA
ncbi:hypothetical protein J1N35_013061 [Gossypium stocksii]|uniref:Uncharacterized protein n=1 Tax=Gossypium stocksii TaxID=47602 RepID=A0A9D4A7J0_9ROSI|nr:hypothetical protein J1N35_013061 [Gossypium stocksii]